MMNNINEGKYAQVDVYSNTEIQELMEAVVTDLTGMDKEAFVKKHKLCVKSAHPLFQSRTIFEKLKELGYDIRIMLRAEYKLGS